MGPSDRDLSFRDLVRTVAERGEPPSPYDRLFSIRIEELGDGTARMSLQVDSSYHNPARVVHGGVLSGLADSAMAYALSTRLEPDESITNIDLTIRFLKATFEGRLTANARVVRAGKTVAVMECEIQDPQGEVVARASSSFIRRAARDGSGWLPAHGNPTHPSKPNP